MSLTSSPASFPGLEPAPQATFELLAGGRAAFERILRRIGEARRSVEMRAFEWRDDDAGCCVARALLAAAERGVKVTIWKDRIGGYYEHLEATKQSFFHKKIGFGARCQLWAMMIFYGRWGSLAQRRSELAEALVAHPNVRFVSEKRFDHAKLYQFDDETVILGGMGIGDDFRDVNVDFMVEISGGDAALRLAARYEGRACFDPGRPFDYLLHAFRGQALTGESLSAQRLQLIAGVRERLTIAMAYLGDPEPTAAVVEAVKRGVQVTLLTAARANVGTDINLLTCARILRLTDSAENLRLVFHPRMVHAKVLVGDGEWVDLGSTNFTRLSHGGYEEVDVFCRDRMFARRVEQAIEQEVRAGEQARLPLDYRLWRLAFELGVSAFQGRSKAR
ncbi:MAG TPA: phosphatidylserine/phosphatidylglycerophosphate/cardiolipin synthase family protein [Polyangia bacterium]|nr:phosphatidylserine/phosphatidylglycerophosphate/cardiolipin synthase family protein [Polyangia bacterium]